VPTTPINLTLLADSLPALKNGAGRTATLLSRDSVTADLCVADHAGLIDVGELGARDEILIVVSGYGRLRCGDGEEMEITEGDVVFVPAGEAPQFERLTARFRIWRLKLSNGA
jgi:hypothetical protein